MSPSEVVVLQKQLMVDYTKCTGCRICEIACSARNEGVFQPSLARLRIVKYDDLGLDIPHVCGPCEDAPCIDICPVYAMRRDPATGVVYVDHDKCILCKSCVGVCVSGVIRLDTVSMRVIKCDHCGGDPECVKVCPTGALIYGTPAQTTVVQRHDKLRDYLAEIHRTAQST
ncbi:MAG: 4Fe-4S dicluster domain-containing protein [Candidatus Thorarchaeota archaeon]